MKPVQRKGRESPQQWKIPCDVYLFAPANMSLVPCVHSLQGDTTTADPMEVSPGRRGALEVHLVH